MLELRMSWLVSLSRCGSKPITLYSSRIFSGAYVPLPTIERHIPGRTRTRACMKQVCLEPATAETNFSLETKEGCDLNPGDRNGRLCQASLSGLATELHPDCKLEHQPRSATSTHHRVPRNRKGRSRAFAGERSQCPSDAPSQHCEANSAGTGDELCFRARVSGIDPGLAYVTRLPRPSHTRSLAAVGCLHYM